MRRSQPFGRKEEVCVNEVKRRVEGVAGIDGLWYKGAHKRIYASGAGVLKLGSLTPISRKTRTIMKLIGKVPTAPGAGTSFWSAELNRLYVAAPANGKEEAAILVFEPQP